MSDDGSGEMRTPDFGSHDLVDEVLKELDGMSQEVKLFESFDYEGFMSSALSLREGDVIPGIDWDKPDFGDADSTGHYKVEVGGQGYVLRRVVFRAEAGDRSRTTKEDFEAEVNLWHKLDSGSLDYPDSLVKFFGAFVGESEGLVLLENAGVAQSKFRAELFARGRHQSPEHIKQYVQDVGAALDWVHSKLTNHGDLGGQNVLFDPKLGVFKLIDMGNAVEINPFNRFVGTPPYFSPERFRREVRDFDFDGIKDDQFAFAMQVYEKLSGGKLPIPAYQDLMQWIDSGFAAVIEGFTQTDREKFGKPQKSWFYRGAVEGCKELKEPGMGELGVRMYEILSGLDEGTDEEKAIKGFLLGHQGFEESVAVVENNPNLRYEGIDENQDENSRRNAIKLTPEQTQQIDVILEKALSSDPDERYESVSELTGELVRVLSSTGFRAKLRRLGV